MRASYEFAPGLGLAIEGDGATISHFNSEYGSAAMSRPNASVVDVAFSGAGGDSLGEWKAARHKTMSWRTQLSRPDLAVIGIRVELAGWPRTFARTLLQGFLIEPLISVAASRTGTVLLPAAAFSDERGAVVVMGPSGSGKTTLTMHALALGTPVLGDDQVLIEPGRTCGAFPRRLRLYADLRNMAPAAYERLPWNVVAQFGARRLVRALSHGAIAPSLAVPISIFGQRTPPAPASIRHVAILRREPGANRIRIEAATVADAVSEATQLLRDQRAHLVLAGGEAWRIAVLEAEDRERRLLEAAFNAASIERVIVPSPLPNGAIASVCEAVGMRA